MPLLKKFKNKARVVSLLSSLACLRENITVVFSSTLNTVARLTFSGFIFLSFKKKINV